jgi:hypothetical protein
VDGTKLHRCDKQVGLSEVGDDVAATILKKSQ